MSMNISDRSSTVDSGTGVDEIKRRLEASLDYFRDYTMKPATDGGDSMPFSNKIKGFVQTELNFLIDRMPNTDFWHDFIDSMDVELYRMLAFHIRKSWIKLIESESPTGELPNFQDHNIVRGFAFAAITFSVILAFQDYPQEESISEVVYKTCDMIKTDLYLRDYNLYDGYQVLEVYVRMLWEFSSRTESEKVDSSQYTSLKFIYDFLTKNKGLHPDEIQNTATVMFRSLVDNEPNGVSRPMVQATAQPTPRPIPASVERPTTQVTAQVTAQPTPRPTTQVTAQVTAQPTPRPTTQVTAPPQQHVMTNPMPYTYVPAPSGIMTPMPPVNTYTYNAYNGHALPIHPMTPMHHPPVQASDYKRRIDFTSVQSWLFKYYITPMIDRQSKGMADRKRTFILLMAKMFDIETEMDELTKTLLGMGDEELRYVLAEMVIEYNEPFITKFPSYFSSMAKIITCSLRNDMEPVPRLITSMRDI